MNEAQDGAHVAVFTGSLTKKAPFEVPMCFAVLVKCNLYNMSREKVNLSREKKC